MSAKDALPGVAILALDQARTSLDAAAEAQQIDAVRGLIAEAQKAIEQVINLAKQAANDQCQ